MNTLVERWKGALRKDLRTLRVVRATLGEGAAARKIVGVRFPPQLVDELRAAAHELANPTPQMLPERTVKIVIPANWEQGSGIDIKLAANEPVCCRVHPPAHKRPGEAYTVVIPSRPDPKAAMRESREGGARVMTEDVTPIDEKARLASTTAPRTIASFFSTAPPSSTGKGNGGASAPPRGKKKAKVTREVARIAEVDVVGTATAPICIDDHDDGGAHKDAENVKAKDAAFARRLQAEENALRGPRKPLKRRRGTGGRGRGRGSGAPAQKKGRAAAKSKPSTGAQASMLSFLKR